MEQSREAARGGHWEDSLKSAIRALQEFSSDADARIAAAVALFNTDKLDRALQIFEELRASDQNNPFHLGYIAQCNSRQGNASAAVTSYRSLADLHIAQHRPAQAVDPLRELLALRPDLDDDRRKLAKLYEELGAAREASSEHLTLARHLYDARQLDAAAEVAELALRLDPNSREAKDLIVTLRDAMARDAGVIASAPAAPKPGSNEPRTSRSGMTSALRSQQFQIEKLIELAIKKQEAGDSDGAADLYEQAVDAGLQRADVLYSLGLIYQERNDHKSAVGVLTRAATDPEYALSSHFALGQSHRELGQLPQAAQEFEQTIALVDLESIGRGEADDLINMYESAATIYTEIGDIARAAALYSTLSTFLEGKRWGRDRAAEFKQRAKELSERNMFAKLRTLGSGSFTPQPGPDAPSLPEKQMPRSWGKIRPITDFLRSDRPATTGPLNELPPTKLISEPMLILESMPSISAPNFAPAIKLDTSGIEGEALNWVNLSDTYLEQGLIEASLDACLEVVRVNVDYLPIHLRMGEIYERQGRPEEAVTKYQLLIDTYRVRNEPERAIDVYFRFIELSPDTVNARTRLAEILKNAGRLDEAVEQLIHVANGYYRLGQSNKALEEYRRLLQWAPKNRDVHSQYGLALLKLERFEAALGEFRKALDLGAANDLIAISRLNITLALMGDQPAAVWDSLATLLDQITQRSQEFSHVQSEYRSALLISDAGILHYILAIIQQHSGQHNSALLELEQAQATLEDNTDLLLHPVLIYQAAADSHIALGNAEEALAQLRKGQAVAGRNPADPNIKHTFAVPLAKGELARRMAEAYAANDDLNGAEQALVEAKKLVPYDRAIHTKLADVYFRQGKLSEALAQLEELAGYYEERQQLDRAIEMLEYALKLAPNHITISGRLARMQLRRGYLDKGVEGLLRAADLQRKAGQLKDAVASLQEAAQVHWMLSEHEKARQVYDKIVQIAPNDVEARQWLALMHTLARRTGEAVAEKKQIARIFAQQRDYDGAIAELHQIIGLDQKDIDAYFFLGDMLMRREEYGQAVQLYGRMLKMEGIEKERVEALATAANRMLQQRQSQTKS